MNRNKKMQVNKSEIVLIQVDTRFIKVFDEFHLFYKKT